MNNKNESSKKKNLKFKEKRRKDVDLKRKSANDPSWYSQNDQLLYDAANLYFSDALGTQLKVESYGNEDFKIDTFNRYTVPGFARIGFTPVFGGGRLPTSPLNIAAKKIYSYVRHANSGHANYESSDLMLYLIGMTQIYAYYAWLSRLYGLARTYNHKNRYYPKAIIQSMKVDFDDVMNNLADLRYAINAFSVRIGSLAIPTGMSYFDRATWIVSGIYLDEDNIKAQSYYFDFDRMWKFSAKTSTSGGELATISTGRDNANSPAKVSDLVAVMNTMLNPMIENEDINIMSGDIIKAYGDNNIIKLGVVTEDFTIEPVYDPVILSQIENLSFFNDMVSVTLTQSDNVLKNEINVPNKYCKHPYFAYNGISKLVNLHTDNPTPQEVMEATRLCAIVPIDYSKPVDIDYWVPDFGLGTIGTELIQSVGFYRITEIGSIELAADVYVGSVPLEATYPVSNFKRHPIWPYVFYNTVTSKLLVSTSYFGDVDNYTIVSLSDLTKLHDTALLSLFTINTGY